MQKDYKSYIWNVSSAMFKKMCVLNLTVLYHWSPYIALFQTIGSLTR